LVCWVVGFVGWGVEATGIVQPGRTGLSTESFWGWLMSSDALIQIACELPVDFLGGHFFLGKRFSDSFAEIFKIWKSPENRAIKPLPVSFGSPRAVASQRFP
jgi:hypothetical protein